MLSLQNKRTPLLYGATAVSLALLGSGIAYYIIQDDLKVKRRKQGRRAERTILRLLQQIKEQEQSIESDIEKVEDDVENKFSNDQEFKKKEYTLAHSNELLLQLMEQLDAIRPLTVIVGTGEVTDFEKTLVSNVKAKKRNVIESIEGLFRRLDIAHVKAKKESERREQVAKEEAEREAERRVKEETKREAERRAKEAEREAERKAKEEAERREKEENERKAREEQEAESLILVEAEAERLVLVEEEGETVTVQEEAVFASLKEVEEEDSENK